MKFNKMLDETKPMKATCPNCGDKFVLSERGMEAAFAGIPIMCQKGCDAELKITNT